MPKPETKFWHELKRITPQIRWTRIENTGVFGTPIYWATILLGTISLLS